MNDSSGQVSLASHCIGMVPAGPQLCGNPMHCRRIFHLAKEMLMHIQGYASSAINMPQVQIGVLVQLGM